MFGPGEGDVIHSQLTSSGVRSRTGWLLCGAIAILAGCGSANGPKTYPVSGIVTLNGKPVADALVQFSAASSPSSGSIEMAPGMAGAQSRTDAEGRYVMSISLDRGKTTRLGLPAGDYAVTVVKMEFPGGRPNPTTPPKNTLPPKYASAQSSQLKATVTPDGENKFDFPL
jgi:hypothetical protein